jgi:hypothetical protein
VGEVKRREIVKIRKAGMALTCSHVMYISVDFEIAPVNPQPFPSPIYASSLLSVSVPSPLAFP